MLTSGSAQLAELSLSRQSRSLGQLYEGAFSPEARGEEEPAPDRPQSQPQAGAPRTRPCHSLPRCRAADEWQSARAADMRALLGDLRGALWGPVGTRFGGSNFGK